MNTEEKTPAIFVLALIVLMFFLSGLRKIRDFQTTSVSMASKFQQKFNLSLGQTVLTIILCCVILIEIVAPMLIMAGYIKEKREWIVQGSSTLIVFTLLATYLYHFPPYGQAYYPFISNVTTIGALSLILLLALKPELLLIGSTNDVTSESGSASKPLSFLHHWTF